MGKPFVIAHISDLHASTFGDTFHDPRRIVRRSAQPGKVPDRSFELVAEERGWKVHRSTQGRRPRVLLTDPSGYTYPEPLVRQEKLGRDPVERAVAKALRLEARRATTLAADLPGEEALSQLLHTTPKNSNLRLLLAAKAIQAAEVDLVVATGDLTDDGDGYELVEAAFQEWNARGRLLAVPGNHDLYLFPIAGSGRPRPTHPSKQSAWRSFASKLGLVLDESGAWVRLFPDAELIVVGLNTCSGPQRRFFRHNGQVGPEQTRFLRRLSGQSEWKQARHRIVALHHHVVPLPHGVGRRAPMELGMRLDDAKATAAVLNEIGVTHVLHGHRHISEERRPAGCQFRLLAAPSLTLGCKSGDGPSFWRIELDERSHASRVYIPLGAVPQVSDPSIPAASEPAVDSSDSPQE